MKVLLDTQVFIWMINNDSRLGSNCRQLVVSTVNEIYMSYLSFFEMTIKATLGKLRFDPTVMSDLDKMGIVLISGDGKSLSLYRIYNPQNKDPFDNFLIATAKANKLRLLSSDHKILETKDTGVEIMNAYE